jgi:hypothetical protein
VVGRLTHTQKGAMKVALKARSGWIRYSMMYIWDGMEVREFSNGGRVEEENDNRPLPLSNPPTEYTLESCYECGFEGQDWIFVDVYMGWNGSVGVLKWWSCRRRKWQSSGS